MDEPISDQTVATLSEEQLKKILSERKVEHSEALEKSELIRLVLKTQTTPKQPPPQYEDVLLQFQRMGLGSRESPNIASCQAALKANPCNATHWYNLGVHLAGEGRMNASRQSYLNSVKYCPTFNLPHNNLGAYYKDRGMLNKAIYHYKKALESDPNFCIALSNIAVTYHVMGLLGLAQDYCRRAVKADPKKAEAHNNLGTLVLHAGCSAAEAVKCFEKAIELDPEQSAGRLGAYSNRLLASNSLPAFCEEDDSITEDVYNAKIWRFHQEWAVPLEERFKDLRFKTWDNDLDPKRAIRIGYLSADIRMHPVGFFLEACLKNYDQSQIELYIYFSGPPGDNKTKILRSEIPDHRFRVLGNMMPRQCAELIRKDKIDILVELGGHASGNRQDIMVFKAAPIQVTYIGYANTTGLKAVDYRITDDIADAPHSHQQFSEELVYMPSPCAFLCYTGSNHSEECTGSRGLERGYITFGSFNALHKLTDQCFELWCRVLNAVPKSRLLLKCKPMASELIRNRYWKRFNSRGISQERIILKKYLPSRDDHMNAYFDLDIGLDPFPYAGTTTSAEALWMGVPFITLNRVKFPIHAQNVGTSILSRIPGMEKFIAKTKQEYVDLAVYWNDHMEELDKIKRNLRRVMLKSPFCDGVLFQKNLTGIYRNMWVKHCQKHSV